jgi:ArsR family metal-binding transcriptional regulator
MSKIDELQKNVALFKEQLDQVMKEAFEKGRLLLSEALTAVFEEYPQVESISWTQYTPYFNDGDACEFSVNSYSIELNTDEVKIENSEKIKGIVTKFLDTIGADSLEQLGEGRVIVLRDGTITVEEYSHD